MELVMSGEKPQVKISLNEAKDFYESVYQAVANEPAILNKQKPEYVSELDKNILAKRQYEYKVLADDFLAVSKARKNSIDTNIDYLKISNETWNIWLTSRNAGIQITPVTFNNAIIFKMAAMVLKDLVAKYLDEKELTSFGPNDIEVIKESTINRLRGVESKPTQQPTSSSSESRHKIRP